MCVNYCTFLDFHFVCVRNREGHIEEESEGAHRKAESKRDREVGGHTPSMCACVYDVALCSNTLK